jgi:flagellar M-ring protein FliF
MNFFQRIAVIWQNIGIVQKALLAAIVLAAVLVGGLFAYWAQMPDMKVLYSGLDPEEAAKITDKISEKGIVYKLNSAGTSIYVPKEHVSQLRLDMAKEGLPNSGQKGYGIFDDEKVGISPFVQNVNLRRALQEELAKSIQMIDGVTHVRIHIVSPESTFFSSQKSQTSASVVLRLKPGYTLSPQNIAAISHIVTGSIEGLKAENVTLVDSQGHLLSSQSDEAMAGGAGTVADYRERVEHNLANKVQDMLTAVLGPGRATVKISAEVNMSSSNTAKETYDDGKKVPSKEEIVSDSEVASNKGAKEGETTPGNTKKNEKILTEYVIPKTVLQTTELAGEIKSLTVAAFVDLSPSETVDETKKDKTADKTATETKATPKPIIEIAEVQDIIKKAVGPKLAADGLKVVNVKFNRPTELPVDEKTGGLDYVQIARQGSFGLMAVCALIVLKIFSGAGKKASAEAAGQFSAAQAGQLAGLLPAGTEASDSLMLRRQIAHSLRNNPEQVKQLFSSWLQEKGS